MLKWYKNFDADDFFSYQTSKIVIIKDRYLGILRLVMVAAILVYVIGIVMIMNQGYLLYEIPVGILYTSLQKPPTETIYTFNLPYCLQYNGTQTTTKDPRVCTVWDEYDTLYPVDQTEAMLITTRQTSQPQERLCPLDALECTTPWGLVKNSNGSEYYVADIETFTIMVKHSFQAREFYQQTGDSRYAQSALQMSGFLADYTGQIIRRFPAGKPDIIALGDLLNAAGCSLNDLSDVPSAAANETMRFGGVIILIAIIYENKVLSQPTYTYHVSRVPNNEYKAYQVITNENVTSRVLNNRHGVKIIFQQSGQIGKFDIQTTLLQLVTSLGLLSISTLIVDNIMLYVMPLRPWYNKYKFQETVDFSMLQDVPESDFKVLSDEDFNASIHKDVKASQEKRSSMNNKLIQN